jgi:hypothetical protein
MWLTRRECTCLWPAATPRLPAAAGGPVPLLAVSLQTALDAARVSRNAESLLQDLCEHCGVRDGAIRGPRRSEYGENLVPQLVRMARSTFLRQQTGHYFSEDNRLPESRQRGEMAYRGSQYASREYRALLASCGMRQSMSRKGDCWDNAVAESFFATPEWELIEDADWHSRAAARREVAEYIEVWYTD